MSSDEEPRKIKVTVRDKRVASQGGAEAASAATPSSASTPEPPPARGGAPSDQAPAAATAAVNGEVAQETDYLAELQRERADFENYRKRMMREVSSSGTRAKSAMAEKLLPVLDNFERAIAHGEGGEGVALVFRELKTALESEGLEEVDAEGEIFDPNLHEAVMSIDDPGVDEPIVKEVYRRGYLFGDQLLRPAMVVVARPVEESVAASVEDAGE